MTESSSLPIVSSTTMDPVDLIKDTALSGDVVRKTITDQAVSWNSRIVTFMSAPYGYAVVGVVAFLLICLCHKYLLKQATTKLISEKNELVIENARLQSGPLALRVQELERKNQELEQNIIPNLQATNRAKQDQITTLTQTIALKDQEIAAGQSDKQKLEQVERQNSGLAAQLRQAQQLFAELEKTRRMLADREGASKAPSSV